MTIVQLTARVPKTNAKTNFGFSTFILRTIEKKNDAKITCDKTAARKKLFQFGTDQKIKKLSNMKTIVCKPQKKNERQVNRNQTGTIRINDSCQIVNNMAIKRNRTFTQKRWQMDRLLPVVQFKPIPKCETHNQNQNTRNDNEFYAIPNIRQLWPRKENSGGFDRKCSEKKQGANGATAVLKLEDGIKSDRRKRNA